MRILKIQSHSDEIEMAEIAASAIVNGGLVIFPTETVYGLAANAMDEIAVQKVYEAKKRSYASPLPIQVGDKAQIEEVATGLTEQAMLLVERFMPGPITLVVKRSALVPDIVTAGGDTVGVRIPDNEVAIAMIRKAGVPIVATSANVSGGRDPLTADDAVRQIGSSVEVVLDSGPVQYRNASTVVDTTVDPPRVIRRGALSVEEIRNVVGDLID